MGRKTTLTLLTVGTMAFLLAMTAPVENGNKNKFRQLHTELRTPNVYRTASGAPGHMYWQQQADYDIAVELDDETQQIHGTETIRYHNNSPDELRYLWIQLDQNRRAQNSDDYLTRTSPNSDSLTFRQLRALRSDFDGGFKLEYVKSANGQPLSYTVNKTMMRVDLPAALKPKATTSLKIKWWYNINDRMQIGGRSGYEYFKEDDNYLYTIAQFYPRMAVYNEVEGWQNKQFLGRGEFTLPFGNFKVSVTVPADHIVAATGLLQNPGSVLTAQQRRRLASARTASQPVIIATEDEARAREQHRVDSKKTWQFSAQNVRDFGFATSRKFIWDAMGVKFGNRTVMAMSLYPKEGNPLWEQYSTKVVAHTLRNYSKHTFDYPYPVAWSINARQIGMEYPMICFNFGRPEKDGTYSRRTKYGMIGVIIHEVGHNFFPMIVNSDERQWTWMDEGMNTFLQFLTEQAWERDFPSRRGFPSKIVGYMKGNQANISPIMTNSESIHQFGNNAYGKPATALNILRETVMGRELFDFAFKEYARRWMFKHPTPDDFFRTMEDASGVDLDWFWRGWFYGTDDVDISIDAVKWYTINTLDPAIEKPFSEELTRNQPEDITKVRNREQVAQTAVEKDAALLDFYNKYDPHEVTVIDKQDYEKRLARMNEDDVKVLKDDYNYYAISFTNHGGLVMPLILQFEYDDGSKEMIHIPAEIWRLNDQHVTKIFPTKKVLTSATLDPFLETADVDMNNNYWPPKTVPTRFKLFKSRRRGLQRENQMQRQRRTDEMTKPGETTGTGSH